MLGTKEKVKVRVEAPTPTRNSYLKDNTASGTNCVISKGTRIEGKFRSSENVRLDGVVAGEIRCDKKVVMGEGGRVEGTLYATDAVIMGTVEGEVIVTGTLQLQATALINGDISARSIIVDEGAQYNGNCRIGQSSPSVVAA